MKRLTIAAAATLTIGLLGGCGGAGEETGGATGEPWYDEVVAAAAVDTVGGGAPCPLPVTFGLADGWAAEPIETPAATDELGDLMAEALTRRGGSTVRCELDGRAVVPGFLRVWTADDPGASARQALEAFVTAEPESSGPQYRQTRAGDLDVVEATWLSRRALTDSDVREWALAVTVADQTVLVEASSTSLGEPVDVLPAYRLARDTLVAAP
ncbi:lipoprotein [Micromonospora palythoicola]|uniref:lipoprotein n=1 Tax=Micromonospora palythoicola TaxID=3120507 RepID=UPI002FCE4C18